MNFNNKLMQLHSFLLVMLTSSTLVYTISSVMQGQTKVMRAVDVTCSVSNLAIQVCIFYLCATIGASESLRRFKCYLVPVQGGGYIVRYVEDHKTAQNRSSLTVSIIDSQTDENK